MRLIDVSYPMPRLLDLAMLHPQLALCVAMGIPLRPNLRPLSVELQNSQLGQQQPASFAEVISQYSVFTGVSVTVDPTNDAPGNPMKYLNDAAQALVTGTTMTLMVQARSGVNYTPIPDETPVQSLPSAFAAAAWVWRLVNPENVKAKFTVQTPLNATPFTLWTVFAFMVPSSDGDPFLQMSNDQALATLVKTNAWKVATGQGL